MLFRLFARCSYLVLTKIQYNFIDLLLINCNKCVCVLKLSVDLAFLKN